MTEAHMSMAQKIRKLVKAEYRAFGSPEANAKRLGCPKMYVLRVAFKATYQSIKAGQRRTARAA